VCPFTSSVEPAVTVHDIHLGPPTHPRFHFPNISKNMLDKRVCEAVTTKFLGIFDAMSNEHVSSEISTLETNTISAVS